MISAGVVADANVLLSTAVGKAALRVFSEYKVPVHTTRFNAEEVMEYLPRLSSKYEITGSKGSGRRSSLGAGPSPLPADLVERF
jgi:hypothetical protein